MKNKTFKMLSAVFVVLALAVSGFAQTQPTKTTLSQAMLAGQNSMIVASVTGAANNWALVGKDLRRVTNVSGTTLTVVQQQGTPSAHPSGANVIYGVLGTWSTNGTASGTFLNTYPIGSCTRSSTGVLPKFVIPENNLSAPGSVDCLNGAWVRGTLLDDPIAPGLYKVCTVPIGTPAYGSMGTDTTTSTTVEYTAGIFVPYTFISTGFTNLNGSAVNTGSKKIFILKDPGGVPIANTLAAGTAATGNDAFQAIAWTTSTKIVVGPAYYGVGLQDDTADVAGIRTVAASTYNGLVGSGPTSVFGTIATLAFPTTFTADVAPIGCLY